MEQYGVPPCRGKALCQAFDWEKGQVAVTHCSADPSVGSLQAEFSFSVRKWQLLISPLCWSSNQIFILFLAQYWYRINEDLKTNQPNKQANKKPSSLSPVQCGGRRSERRHFRLMFGSGLVNSLSIFLWNLYYNASGGEKMNNRTTEPECCNIMAHTLQPDRSWSKSDWL